jgi:hypothetical protein
VVHESTLIAIVSGIDAEREEILIGDLLYLDIVFVAVVHLIHVKEVAHSVLVIILAAFVSLFGCQDLPDIFENKGSHGNGLLGKETPHGRGLFLPEDVNRLLDPLDEDFPFVFISLFHEVIETQVFIARASRMALVKGKGPPWLACARLDCDHLVILTVKHFVIHRLFHGPIVLIASAFFRVLASVRALAKGCSVLPFEILCYLRCDLTLDTIGYVLRLINPDNISYLPLSDVFVILN